MTEEDPSNLFAGTASYYRRYRPEYPTALFDTLVSLVPLTSESRVLDLGCGTGKLAIPLAKRGIQVSAVDPNQDMLEQGRRAAKAAGTSNIMWICGQDRDIEKLVAKPISLCMMGASFHWMQREELLERLERMIENQGAVAVITPIVGLWSDQGPPWSIAAKEVVQQFLGSERRVGSQVYQHHEKRHEDLIRESPFAVLERQVFANRRTISCEEIIGLQLSTSYASPQLLGDKLDSFVAALRQKLMEISPTGQFEDELSVELLLARRPEAF